MKGNRLSTKHSSEPLSVNILTTSFFFHPLLSLCARIQTATRTSPEPRRMLHAFFPKLSPFHDEGDLTCCRRVWHGYVASQETRRYRVFQPMHWPIQWKERLCESNQGVHRYTRTINVYDTTSPESEIVDRTDS